MKLFKFFITAALLSTIFMACGKDKYVMDQVPSTEKPGSQVSLIEGRWEGVRLGPDRSIPFHFYFQIKTGGKLDVLSNDKQVIGTGIWSFKNDVLQAKYSLPLSGETHLFKSDFYNKADKIAGTWGHDDNDTEGGQWQMDKIN